MKLKTRLLVIGIAISVVPLLATSLIMWQQNSHIAATAESESLKQTIDDMDHIAQSI